MFINMAVQCFSIQQFCPQFSSTFLAVGFGRYCHGQKLKDKNFVQKL
jgi:hypothetical protein